MKTKKKKNIIAIGGCFITTLLLQIYSIELVHVSILFPIGLGLLALIIGYFFMDAIRQYVEQDRMDDKFYLDHAIGHESEKWQECYTELLNMQKATYTATKKNTEYQLKQFEEVLLRLEALEKNQAASLNKIIELQTKALEGQKKALNIEINHSKENVNKIMERLQEEPKQDVSSLQFEKLLSLEENNQKLFQDQLNRLVEIKDHLEVVEKVITQAPAPQRVFIDDYYQEEPVASDEQLTSGMFGLEEEASKEEEDFEDKLEETFAGIYEDTFEGISQKALEVTQEEILEGVEESSFNEIQEAPFKHTFMENYLQDSNSLEDTTMGIEVMDSDLTNEFDSSMSYETKENASEADQILEDLELEAAVALNEDASDATVLPIYDDPNKALTADEIAKLFASFGQ